MAIGRNRSKIADKGGNYLLNVVLASTTAVPGFALPTISSSNTYDLGDLASSQVGQQASRSSIKNEKGEDAVVTYDLEGATTAVLLQGDGDLLWYLAQTVKDKFILEFKHTGTVNGLDQWFVKIGQVTPQIAVARPGGANSLNYEHTRIDLESDFTIPAADIALIAATIGITALAIFPTVTVTIPATASFTIVEVP